MRSVNSIVIAPASTGKDKRSRIAVSKTLQTKSGIKSIDNPLLRIFMIVVMKLVEPRILLTPAICKEKMPKSTAPPGCPVAESGG